MSTPQTPTTPSGRIDRGSGRTLAWQDEGHPDGPPVIFCHGSPACRIGWPGLPRAAAALGLRLITPDRPGCGASSIDRDRTIGGWAADVSALADHLGLDGYHVVGESGGGPYAVACAAGGDSRVRRVAVVCGVGPLDRPEERARLQVTRAVFDTAAAGPEAALPFVEAMVAAAAPSADAVADQDGPDALAELLAALPEPDQAVLRADPTVLQASNLAEAAVHGSTGLAHDLWLFTRPWDVHLERIAVPVDLYAADQDANVPLHHTTDLHERLPTSNLTIWPGAGHLSGVVRLPEVLSALTRPV